MLRPRRYCGTMSASARSTEVYGDKSRCTELEGLEQARWVQPVEGDFGLDRKGIINYHHVEPLD
ncbi:MAG: hypothetical protein OXC82_00690 [Rhodobacteraceae bacterium]|nr:hypothetical protein [Paracoccaceae bacterium]MCY4248944.1 hypothetical protein [Paracoccaceae bacterium]